MHATVWALHKRFGVELSVGRVLGFVAQLLCESSPSSNDERHGSLLIAENILAIHCDLFLAEILCAFGPRDGEGMRCHELDGGNIEIGVLTSLESPGSLHLNGNSNGMSR